MTNQTQRAADTSTGVEIPAQVPKGLGSTKNPFKNGFIPPSNVNKKGKSYLHKKTLLRMMLETPLTVADLPTHIADKIRLKCPGVFENVERKFTFYQILEVSQLQLLFSNSDYVVQDAINAIKDRVEGKPMQMVQVQGMEAEPTEFTLPGGRKIVI